MAHKNEVYDALRLYNLLNGYRNHNIKRVLVGVASPGLGAAISAMFAKATGQHLAVCGQDDSVYNAEIELYLESDGRLVEFGGVYFEVEDNELLQTLVLNAGGTTMDKLLTDLENVSQVTDELRKRKLLLLRGD